MFFTNSLYNNILQIDRILCIYTTNILENYINNWSYLDQYITYPDGDSHFTWRCLMTIHNQNGSDIEFYYDNLNNPLVNNDPNYTGLKINYVLLYNSGTCLALYKLPSAYYSNSISFNNLKVILKLSTSQIQLTPVLQVDYSEHKNNNNITHRIKQKSPNAVSTINDLPKLNHNVACNNQTQIIRDEKEYYRLYSSYYHKNDTTSNHDISGSSVLGLNYKNPNIYNNPINLYLNTLIEDREGTYWELIRGSGVEGMWSTNLNETYIDFITIGLSNLDYIDKNIIIVGNKIYRTPSVNDLQISLIYDGSNNYPTDIYSFNDGSIIYNSVSHVMDNLTFDTYLYKIDTNNNYVFKSRNFHNLLVSLSFNSSNIITDELYGNGIAAITSDLIIYTLNGDLNNYDYHGHITGSKGIIIFTPEFKIEDPEFEFDRIVLLSKNLFITRNTVNNDKVWFVNEITTNGKLISEKLGLHTYDKISINKFYSYDYLNLNNLIPVNYKGRLLKKVNQGSGNQIIVKRF